MRRAIWMMAPLALMLGGVGRVNADFLLYDNGLNNSTYGAGAANISNPNSVSDSFTLRGAATLTSVQVQLETNSWQLGSPNIVFWEIGTTPFGSDVGSGTGTPTITSVMNSGDWSLFESTFSLPQMAMLGAGTYDLTLENPTTIGGQFRNGLAAWSVGNGSSSAEDLFERSVSAISSKSFQIYGNEVYAIPAPPSNLALVGTALATGLGYFGWRRRKLSAA